MTTTVLVLNASYEPLRLIDWQRCITLLWENKVDIIESDPSRFIRSPSVQIPFPLVVKHKKYVAAKRKVLRFSRENVYLRDGGKCAYCGEMLKRNKMTYDHVVPKAQGGQTNWQNVVTCCTPCNQRKGGRTPEKAGMPLLVKPVKPTSLPDVVNPNLKYNKNMPQIWRQWLFENAYMNTEIEDE